MFKILVSFKASGGCALSSMEFDTVIQANTALKRINNGDISGLYAIALY